MKRLLIFSLMIGLAILFILAGKSFAQTTSSVTVSLSIPVMPGLNAPLIEESKAKNAETTIPQDKIKPEEVSQEVMGEMIQSEKQEENVADKNEKNQIIVKTFYSR
jgi:hypothetical protein